MKQIPLKINSLDTHVKTCDRLYELFQEHKYLRISVLLGKDRSAEQNRTWSGMYKAIWMQADGKFEGFDYARAYCKWHIGIPILKRDVEGFALSFDTVFGKLSYERCLDLMKPNKLFPSDGFPVTRHFGVKQGCEYIDNIAKHFDGREAPYIDFSELLKEED